MTLDNLWPSFPFQTCHPGRDFFILQERQSSCAHMLYIAQHPGHADTSSLNSCLYPSRRGQNWNSTNTWDAACPVWLGTSRKLPCSQLGTFLRIWKCSFASFPSLPLRQGSLADSGLASISPRLTFPTCSSSSQGLSPSAKQCPNGKRTSLDFQTLGREVPEQLSPSLQQEEEDGISLGLRDVKGGGCQQWGWLWMLGMFMQLQSIKEGGSFPFINPSLKA